MLKLYYLKYGEIPEKERNMKNYLKALIALMLALACVIACVSCKKDDNTGNGDGGSTNDGGNTGADNNVVKPPVSDDTEIDEETYRIRFVYSYTAKVVNDNGRTENKKEVVTVKSLYVNIDNNGLSSDLLAEIAGLTYNGYSFASWHADWDKDSQTANDAAVNFADLGKVSKDLTFYGERGNLAGPTATWRVEYQYPEVEEEEVAPTADEAEGEEQPEEVAPIGAILYIEGTGRMFDFENGNEIDVKWFKDQKLIHTVKIADGITNVGANSFKNFSKLTTVELPASITEIGEAAFMGAGLKKFTAPANLTVIQKNGFANTSLKEVTLNEGITTLAAQAFYGSNKISTIVIPSTLKSIGNSAFHQGQGNTSHNLNSGKVYFKGDEAGFAKIDISMDNLPLVEFATKYYYKAYNAAEAGSVVGSYWRYAEEEQSADTSTWVHPIQYCFVLSYTNEASKIPFHHISIPANPQFDENGAVITDEEGVPILKGIVTEEIYNAHKGIRYNGYTYASFTGGKTIEVGAEINADVSYTCVRGDILSEDGGIKFTYANNIITVYKDENAEQRIKDDVTATIKSEIKKALTAEEIAGLDDAAIAALVDEKFAAEEVQADFNGRVSARLAVAYKIWDFSATTDTGLLWNKALSELPKVKALVIGEGVEKIGKLAFNGLSAITEVIIPASVTEIAPDAFSGCGELVSIYYNGNIDAACPSLNNLGNRRSNIYSYVEGATAESGKYWTKIGDSSVAWILNKEAGTLTIGGDDVMVNFESADAAPWFGAKDSITTVTFGTNIKAIGTNTLNGYDKVTEISLPTFLEVIPESAFVGTAIVNDVANYDKGILIIDDHLIKVDATKKDDFFFETPYGIFTIADGAFRDCTSIKRIYLTRTITRINPEAFPDSDIEYIFTDGDEAYWDTIETYVDFGDARVLYKSDKRPTRQYTDENGKTRVVYSDGTHWRKLGNDYVIWGCDHVWSDWYVTKAPTCDKTGTESRFCLYDVTHVETKSVAMVDHTYGDYVANNDATCVNAQTESAICSGCGAEDKREILVPIVDENGDPVLDADGNPTYEKIYGECNFEGAEYIDNNDRNCTQGMTETANCLNEGCTLTDTREDLDQPALGHIGVGGVAWAEAPYELIPDSANCVNPYGMMKKVCARVEGVDGFTCGHEEKIPATADKHPDDYVPATCVFTAEVVDAKYFAAAATKTEPAKYYKSCTGCGKVGTDTFNAGEALSFYDFESMTDVSTILSTTSTPVQYAWNKKDATNTGNYAMISTVGSAKVLEIGRNSVTTGWAKLLIANKNAKTATNAVHVLDTDIQLVSLTQSGTGFITRIFMYNGNQAFFTLEIYAVDADTVTFKIMNDLQNEVVAETNLNMDLTKWYNLRVEYVVGVGKAEKVTITLTDKTSDVAQTFEVSDVATSYDNATFHSVMMELRCNGSNYITNTAYIFDDMYFGAVSYADLYGAVAE